MASSFETIKPKIGVSACLLGQSVRYDGGHKRHGWMVEQLASFVDFIPVCPELEMGLGVPRPTLRLVNDALSNSIQLQQTSSGTVLNQKSLEISFKLKSQLEQVDGMILMKKSPSCGLERVPVFFQNKQGDFAPSNHGMGLFAAQMKHFFPLIPMIDSGRLENKRERDFFLRRLWTWSRWKQVTRSDCSVSHLQKFHAQHKYLLMEFMPSGISSLGRLLATVSSQSDLKEVSHHYEKILGELLGKSPTVPKRQNVLEHIWGYFKKNLDKNEKKQAGDMMDAYKQGKIPYVAVVKLLEFLVRKYEQVYLQDQYWFAPYPADLMILPKEDHF
jgi:uncharacterized protein YbbK (DUF523 family)/uncharacterized protein YbgA (DUF1722 family)